VSSAVSSVAQERQTQPADRRWLVLVVVSVAQLMVVLDATIVNIALPSAQRALGFPNSDRQWVVTAYALAFGSLLLVGGRLGDMFNRKWVFITGLIGFALASAVGGAAGSFVVLVTARALQGVFGALLAPSALGTLVSTFRDPRERGRAFGVFGSVAGTYAICVVAVVRTLKQPLEYDELPIHPARTVFQSQLNSLHRLHLDTPPAGHSGPQAGR